MSAQPFSVLFVCTGNICRSPIAEQVARAEFPSDSVTFSSAGTGALVGHGMTPQAELISQGFGGQQTGEHLARQLTVDMLTEADLVITMTREHRADAVRMLTKANKFTFTIREFSLLVESCVNEPIADPRLLLDIPLPDLLRSAVGVMAAQRGYAETPARAEDYDVVDPFGQAQSVYDEAGANIHDSLTRIVLAIHTLASNLG